MSQWDRKSGYRTRSILCVPIIDELHGGKCIGCLQLINKRDRYDRRRTVRNRNCPVSSATARQPGLYGRGPLDKPVGVLGCSARAGGARAAKVAVRGCGAAVSAC